MTFKSFIFHGLCYWLQSLCAMSYVVEWPIMCRVGR